MFLYRILEYLSGQTSADHKRIIPYRTAQRLKLLILIYLIRG